ncbi:HEPN domain-containing protein [Brevundimonas sp.]|uniref:HEPN domain-containing protein n=1 Tax=Brevundimonas sp. TaxID=1871086 RepID=UPI00289CEC4E|nr:HEPN domain-containing protein [Brevundimonas sp.]
MTTVFALIFEEFEQELEAIELLVSPHGEERLSARARVAGANASVLLLAATFEEFTRELAREYAKSVVAATDTHERLPPKIAAIAWKRTMEGLARLQFVRATEPLSRDRAYADAQARFAVAYEFCRGDLTQDIYSDLIHNENNMRPQEINALFKLSGLSNICLQASDAATLKEFFDDDSQAIVHGRLLAAVEDFFDRRNQTAHELRAMSSVGPDLILADINLLKRFGQALAGAAENEAPDPIER